MLEVLITLVILSVSLLALAGLMVTTAHNTAYGGYMTEAVTFAQDKLEEFRAIQWERILPTTAGPRTDGTTGATGIQYARSWNIVEQGSFKTVTVAVNWNDRINHSVRLFSVVSR